MHSVPAVGPHCPSQHIHARVRVARAHHSVQSTELVGRISEHWTGATSSGTPITTITTVTVTVTIAVTVTVTC